MSERVYIETTIVGYLTDRPGGDLAMQAKKRSTKHWWKTQRESFDSFTSELVAQEAGRGHPEAAQRRLDALSGLPSRRLLERPARWRARLLARKITGPGMIPGKYSDDALHVAIATINGMDYLLTWNLSHIANATLRRKCMSQCFGQKATSHRLSARQKSYWRNSSMKDKANGSKTRNAAWSDPIVEEIHAMRERYARKFDYDMEAIVEDLKRRQEESGREVVSFPPKRIGEDRREEGLA